MENQLCIELKWYNVWGTMIEYEKKLDHFFMESQSFEGGKVYALAGEYGLGNEGLAYLLSGNGKVCSDRFDYKILQNGKSVSFKELQKISCNIEVTRTKLKNKPVRKTIEKSLKSGATHYCYHEIQEMFGLTKGREMRKFWQLSGERWRASIANGYCAGKQLYFAPYETNVHYDSVLKQGFSKCLDILRESNAIVLLPVASDSIMFEYVDEVIMVDAFRNIQKKQKRET